MNGLKTDAAQITKGLRKRPPAQEEVILKEPGRTYEMGQEGAVLVSTYSP